jgi:hypothetical protein
MALALPGSETAMDLAALAQNPSTASRSAGAAQNDAFRSADFMKIMLSELAHQDPFSPQETSKIVENMQKLQELANTQYTKFRSDLNWAQQLIGQQVNVQQIVTDDAGRQALVDAGLNPDVGYQNVQGTVSSFRQVGEQVYLSVAGHDYPIDNVRQVVPKPRDPDQLVQLASQMVGFNVGFWRKEPTDVGQGVVTDVAYGLDDQVMLTIGDEQVPYSHLQSIGAPR